MNNFLSGVCFYVFINEFTIWEIDIDNDVVLVWLLYFVGIIISRVGSLLIEPTLKTIPYISIMQTVDSNGNNSRKIKLEKFLLFKPYRDFIEAERVDKKIDTLSAINNIYRSMISVCFCVLIVKIYEITLHGSFSVMLNGNLEVFLGAILLMIFFSFSYRKQTSYVVERIEKSLKKHKDKQD